MSMPDDNNFGAPRRAADCQDCDLEDLYECERCHKMVPQEALDDAESSGFDTVCRDCAEEARAEVEAEAKASQSDPARRISAAFADWWQAEGLADYDRFTRFHAFADAAREIAQQAWMQGAIAAVKEGRHL